MRHTPLFFRAKRIGKEKERRIFAERSAATVHIIIHQTLGFVKAFRKTFFSFCPPACLQNAQKGKGGIVKSANSVEIGLFLLPLP